VVAGGGTTQTLPTQSLEKHSPADVQAAPVMPSALQVEVVASQNVAATHSAPVGQAPPAATRYVQTPVARLQ